MLMSIQTGTVQTVMLIQTGTGHTDVKAEIQWEQCCQYIKLQKCQQRHEQTGKFSTANAVNTEMYIALRGNVELPVNERFASPRLTQSRRKTPVWSNHT